MPGDAKEGENTMALFTKEELEELERIDRMEVSEYHRAYYKAN